MQQNAMKACLIAKEVQGLDRADTHTLASAQTDTRARMHKHTRTHACKYNCAHKIHKARGESYICSKEGIFQTSQPRGCDFTEILKMQEILDRERARAVQDAARSRVDAEDARKALEAGTRPGKILAPRTDS